MAIQPTRQEADSTGTLNQYAHLYDVEDEAMEREKSDEQLSEEIAGEVSERKEADEEIKGMIHEAMDINSILPLKVNKAAKNYGDTSVAFGSNAVSNNSGSVALGYGSTSSHNSSVALGYNSRTSKGNQVSVGNTNNYRYISFVEDPVLFHEAATKNYVDRNTVNTSSSSITVDGNKAKLNPAIFSDGLTATDAQVSLDMGFVGEHLAGDGLYYDSTDGLRVKVGDGLEVQNDQICIDQDKLPFASTNGSNRGVARYDPNREIHINEDGYVTVQSATETRRGVVKAGSGLNVATDGTLSVDTSASSGTEIIEFNQTLDKTGFTCTGYFIGYLREEATQGGTSTLFTPIKASLLIQLTAAFASGTSIDIPDLGEFSYQASVEDVYQVNASYGTGNYVMSIEGNYTGSVKSNLRKIYLYSSLPSGTVINLVR